MPTSNAEELRLFLKCTVIGRGVFGPCACCDVQLTERLQRRIQDFLGAPTERGGRIPSYYSVKFFLKTA